MSDMKKKLENFKDKTEGRIKENVGKATGNKELEMKGKLKKTVVVAKEKISDLKEDVDDKINNIKKK